MSNLDALVKEYSSEEVGLLVEAFVEDLSFWESSYSESQEKKELIERLTSEETKRNMALAESRGKRNTRRVKDQHAVRSESPPSEHKQEPSNWRTAVDPMSGKMYYYDTITRRTQWEKVSGLSISFEFAALGSLIGRFVCVARGGQSN